MLGCRFPATPPPVLARYGRIRAAETLATEFVASAVLCYVIAGSGSTSDGTERIDWAAGDVVVLPGGIAFSHTAGDDGAVLWIVTTEPQLAFESLRPPAEGHAPTEIIHFTAAEIARQIALIFSSAGQEAGRNILPTLTLAMNSLPGGRTQRPHRHNALAVSLIIRGDRCFSLMDGKRKDWAPWATTITPPVSVHSHHNEGNEQAMFLIVQDGGFFYHARSMGFEFAEHRQ